MFKTLLKTIKHKRKINQGTNKWRDNCLWIRRFNIIQMTPLSKHRFETIPTKMQVGFCRYCQVGSNIYLEKKKGTRKAKTIKKIKVQDLYYLILRLTVKLQ